jgi:hypothetical protein
VCERRILQFYPQEGAEPGVGERVGVGDEEVVEVERERPEEHDQESEPGAYEEEILRTQGLWKCVQKSGISSVDGQGGGVRRSTTYGCALHAAVRERCDDG